MKKISLNGHVRAEIIRRIMRRWREQNPKPEFSGMPTADQCRQMEEIRTRETDYRFNLSLALGTFRTVHELAEEWPEIEQYIPDVLTNPRQVITLP